MKKALITGISGQDGKYLAELLIAKKYIVIGLTRSRKVTIEKLPKKLRENIELVEYESFSQESFIKILNKYSPNEIYNFAALTSGEDMYLNPQNIMEVNAGLVHKILEAIRQVDKNIRFCQASSREIFGESLESPQSETTLKKPRSPYGEAKLHADNMVSKYRNQYDLFLSTAILFNHESPRRGHNFVTRKISSAAAEIKLGMRKELKVGDLNTTRDWGYAGDFVKAMWLMLQADKPDDYVIATGKLNTIKDICKIAFSHLGLDYKLYVKEDLNISRRNEPVTLVGDIRKAKRILNWSPNMTFEKLIKNMVDHDLKEQKKIIKKNNVQN